MLFCFGFLGQADLNHVPAIFHDYRIIAIINFGSGTPPLMVQWTMTLLRKPNMLKSDVVKSYIMNDAGNMMNWAVFLLEMFKIDFLDGPTWAIKILLLEEIPNNHLGCIKPCKYWDTLPTSTGEGRISSIISIKEPNRADHTEADSVDSQRLLKGKTAKSHPIVSRMRWLVRQQRWRFCYIEELSNDSQKHLANWFILVSY